MTETKTVEFESLDEAVGAVKEKGKVAETAVCEYQAMVKAMFGPMPKNEIELVAFIQKVMKYR